LTPSLFCAAGKSGSIDFCERKNALNNIKECKGMEVSDEEPESGSASMTSDYLFMLQSYSKDNRIPDKIFVIESYPKLNG
jgi:hypothetical protein